MDVGVLFNIVPRLLPIFMLGIVAFFGLLLQRKSGSDVVTGTIKTMVGVAVLFAGVDILVSTIEPIAQLFGQVYTYESSAAVGDWVGFLGTFGVEVVLIMVFGFLVNLVLARITPWKYVFLTGHILFWNAFMVTAALADGGKINGVLLIVVGSILLGIISTLLPALIAPTIRKLTGNNDFSIGHTTTIHGILGAWIGKLFGDPSNSTEDMELSGAWGFMKSMTVSTSIIMFLLYIIMGFVAGLPFAAETFAGGSTLMWFFVAALRAITFGAGLTVLLTGVRIMLAEIIPAFHGLAQKVVPEAVPALDCPMIFPYGENALAIGFPIAMIFSLLALVLFGALGYKYLLLPLVVAAFFDVGPGVILANATGGRRGAIIYAAIGGVLLMALNALAIPLVTNSGAGFLQLFGGNDFALIAIVIGGISRLLGF
jgi:PTS system ascorbate-specific IIC component